MPFVRTLVLSIFGLLMLTAVGDRPLLAQEDTDSEAAQETVVDIAELSRQWKELDAELANKEAEFNAATEADVQEDIRGQYQALVTQSEELVAKIRERAIESLDAGSLDEATSKLLVGLIMNDASFGRHNDAIKLGDRYITAGGDGALLEQAARADRLSLFAKELLEELFVRFNQAKQNDLPQVKIETSKGSLVVELFEDEAPNTVANFVSLVESKFYDGLKFHRVIEGFVAQGGDPEGNGSGGPGYSIKCECDSPETRRHFMGSLSMAHAGKDTGGSQFFLCLDRTSNLDGRHTVFGRVIDGIDVLDRLSRNYTPSAPIEDVETDVINSMIVVRKRDHEYKPEKNGDESPQEQPETPPTEPETLKDASDSDEVRSESGEESGEESGGDGG